MEAQWHDSLTLQLIGLLLILIGIALARKIINIFPSVVGCFIRGKECFNLEDSVKLQRDRNAVAIFCTPVVAFIVMIYRLWSPRFSVGLSFTQLFFVSLGVIIVYIGIRELLCTILRPSRSSRGEFSVARGEFYTFLILATLLSCISCLILSVLKVQPELCRYILYGEFGLVFLVHFLRKAQILGSMMPYFRSFLYLCALEILPTAALIAPAIFL